MWGISNFLKKRSCNISNIKTKFYLKISQQNRGNKEVIIDSNSSHSKIGNMKIKYKIRKILGIKPFTARILGILVLYLKIVILIDNKETANPPKAIIETNPCRFPRGPFLSKLKIPTNNIPKLPTTPRIELYLVIL